MMHNSYKAASTTGRPSVSRWSEQSASSFIKHLQEQSHLDTRITFEIPTVTSHPPKPLILSLKYLHVRERGIPSSIAIKPGFSRCICKMHSPSEVCSPAKERDQTVSRHNRSALELGFRLEKQTIKKGCYC